MERLLILTTIDQVRPAQMHTTSGRHMVIKCGYCGSLAASQVKVYHAGTGVVTVCPNHISSPNASTSAPPTCPLAPMTSKRLSGGRPVTCTFKILEVEIGAAYPFRSLRKTSSRQVSASKCLVYQKDLCPSRTEDRNNPLKVQYVSIFKADKSRPQRRMALSPISEQNNRTPSPICFAVCPQIDNDIARPHESQLPT